MNTPNRLLLLILIALLLASLACQAATRAFAPAHTPELHARAHTLERAATPTPSPTSTYTPIPLSPTPTLTATPAITPSALQLRVFEELWGTIRDEYLYPDFNGLDWDAIYTEYRQRIDSGMKDLDFYLAMDEMVSRLGDDHSTFLGPEEASGEDQEFAGENDYVGIGILSIPVPERKRVVIIVVFPDSPAERAGLQSHDSITAADGQAILDENGFRRELLRGPEGTRVTLTVQSPGQDPRMVTLTRRRVTGSVPVPSRLLTSAGGKRIGYILLPTFADALIDEKVGEALLALAAEARLDGLILDNRQNGGGADNVTRSVLGYFARGVVGHFVDRNQEQRAFRVMGGEVANSAELPLVILVGPNTASFAEIFSGVLRDLGRAYLIGETTEGNVELLWGFNFEDGSRAWIAHEAFRPLNHPQDDWELTGIIPDLPVQTNWDEITLDIDPAIQAALGYFDQP